MTLNHCAPQSRQAGASLAEMALALAIFAIMSIGIASAIGRDRDTLALATVASRIGEVRTAADRYIRDNFSQLEQDTAASGPQAVSVAMMRNGAYLPASFDETNSFQQQVVVYVRRRAPGVLESLVTATGGQSMTAAQGGQVARLLKGSGGFVPIGGADAEGTKGSWRASLAAFVPGGWPRPSGHAVAYSLNRKVDGPTGALMRDATGNPADNRMNTDLDMNNNRILNVRDLQVGGQVINNTTIANINDLAGVNCANGQALTKIGSSFMCTDVGGVPNGSVIAYTGACPSGWQIASELAGRVLVATGNGYTLGETGGSDALTLTEQQMPAHRHGAGVMSGGDANPGTMYRWGGRSAYGNNAAAHANSSGRYEAWTSTDGGGQPFDNRQAYYAVNFCRKL